MAKVFKAYALFSYSTVGKSSDKPNTKKHFSRKVEMEASQGVDDIQINIFESKKPNAKVIKCFNCDGSRHGIKKCCKLKNECLNCQFLRDFHKKKCQKNATLGTLAQTTYPSPPAIL